MKRTTIWLPLLSVVLFSSRADDVFTANIFVVNTQQKLPGVSYYGMFGSTSDVSRAHVLFLAVDNLTDVTSVANISVGCDSFFIPKELLPVMVVMKRGGCLFADKAMNAFSAGAIGMLVVDSFDSNAPPQMQGSLPDEAQQFVPVSITQSNANILIHLHSIGELTINVTKGDKIPDELPNLHLSKWLFGHVVIFGVTILVLASCVLASYHCRSWAERREIEQQIEHRQDIMSSLPTRSISETDLAEFDEGDQPVCAICICDFEEGDEVRVLPCKHEFHTECIDPWLEEQPTCPLCKLDVYASLMEQQSHPTIRRRWFHFVARRGSTASDQALLIRDQGEEENGLESRQRGWDDELLTVVSESPEALAVSPQPLSATDRHELGPSRLAEISSLVPSPAEQQERTC